MQNLSDNFLKYRPNTLGDVRKLYNLDKPGQMEQAVEILDAWIKKQDHFVKKDFSPEYLERVIILLKGSVERAKSQLDKICTLRTAMPKFFEFTNPRKQLQDLEGYAYQSLLPNLTEENCRIYFIRMSKDGPHTQRKFFLIYFNCILMNEYVKINDYSDGMIIAADLRGVNVMDLVSGMNLTDLSQITTITTEGYDARIKSIHLISDSKAIDLLVKVLKQIMNQKLANRIHVHKNIAELYELVPQSLLPKDYGGDEKTLAELNDEFLDVLSSDENIKYLKEMRTACTDESRRSVSTFNESYLGLAGTFRTLNVD